jgi:hypothetical protein
LKIENDIDIETRNNNFFLPDLMSRYENAENSEDKEKILKEIKNLEFKKRLLMQQKTLLMRKEEDLRNDKKKLEEKLESLKKKKGTGKIFSSL